MIVNVLHTARVHLWAVATIPVPEPRHALETSVRLGERGPQYIVVTYPDGEHRVYPTYLPRRRSMRERGRRRAILAAVERALPHTTPLSPGAS
jgi:hypothetical protein